MTATVEECGGEAEPRSERSAQKTESAVDLAAPVGPDGVGWLRSRAWLDPLVATLASSVLFVLGFGGGLGRLRNPLGAGDLLPAYAAAHLWGQASPFGNNSLGYPFGIEQRYYPTADVAQNLLAGLLTAVTGNPFFGMNAVFAVSFPVTALAAMWTLRLAGLRGPFAVIAALALTFIPYHWFRIDHIYLGTMYSAVLGVGLALLVGSGAVGRRLRSGPRRGRFMLGLAVVVLAVGTGGIYYACFAVLLCLVATGYRAVTGSRWREVLLATGPAIGVIVVLGACLAPATLFVRSHPSLAPVAGRLAVESVVYSGALAFTLLPAPVSDLPGAHLLNDVVKDALAAGQVAPTSGVLWYADFGSVATVMALAILVVGACLLVRRAARARTIGQEPPLAGPPSLAFLGLLLATTVLFFVPWGLNYLFAYFVTPQLRGWDRLVPVLFTLVFIGAGVVLKRLTWRPRRPVVIALLCASLVVIVLDSVWPYRTFFTAAVTNGAKYSQAGYAYAAALNAAVPGQCAVLELPFVGYPEEPPKVGMSSYEPLWPALTNPEKRWSFGAMKRTAAEAWQKALGDDIGASDVPDLRAGGFCAVHVDRRAYTPSDADRVTSGLTRLLGAPVAVGLDDNWQAFAIPSPRAVPRNPNRLTEASGSVGTFYAPPQFTPGPGAPPLPTVDSLASDWWLSGGSATFDIRSLVGGPSFATVRGSIRDAACADREVAVHLRTGGESLSASLHVRSGQQADFSLKLEHPTKAAQLSVTTSGDPCSVAGSGGATTVALVDPEAVG